MSHLHEVGDMNARAHIARIIDAYLLVESANDPRKQGEQVGGSSGKPGSKPPGREACAGKHAHAVRLLADCAQKLENTVANATALVITREAHETPVARVGGHTIDVSGEGGERKLVARRNARGQDGKFQPGAQMSHLAGKLQQAVEGERRG